MKQNSKTRKLVLIAIFIAIEVVLAMSGVGYIPLGFMNATIIHIPVILGAILLGPKEGILLGAVFGLTSVLNNTFKPNLTSFVFSPFYSVGQATGNIWSLVIAFVPRMMIAVTAYYTYKLIARKNKLKDLAYLVAGVVGSLTNTILVMGGIYLFFGEHYAAAKGIAIQGLFGVIMTVVAVNGVPEAIVAGVLSLVLCRTLSVVARGWKEKT